MALVFGVVVFFLRLIDNDVSFRDRARAQNLVPLEPPSRLLPSSTLPLAFNIKFDDDQIDCTARASWLPSSRMKRKCFDSKQQNDRPFHAFRPRKPHQNWPDALPLLPSFPRCNAPSLPIPPKHPTIPRPTTKRASRVALPGRVGVDDPSPAPKTHTFPIYADS